MNEWITVFLISISLLHKRLIEIAKRKKQKELKEKEKDERRKSLEAEMGEDGEKELQGEEEEEEEPLPEIFIPLTPCHILCGFYSGPGKFWVSLVSNNVINFYLNPNLIIGIIFHHFLTSLLYGKTSAINYYRRCEFWWMNVFVFISSLYVLYVYLLYLLSMTITHFRRSKGRRIKGRRAKG